MDSMILAFDRALRAVTGCARGNRPRPDADLAEVPLEDVSRRHALGLMRVNHAGEVCAQALYQGQAWFSRAPLVAGELRRAAAEEVDHLDWTARRVRELGGYPSLLGPFWYLSSLVLGGVAGALGDRWSLGFLAETERQVGAHLARHLEMLPEDDCKSRQIVVQMRVDELNHAATAERLGAYALPAPVPQGMRLAAKVMTVVAYRL